MGYWGFYLFENDPDHDIIGDLANDVGVKDLHHFENKEDEQKAKDLLNDGLYDKLIEQYNSEKGTGMFDNPSVKVILLTACAMELGVKISHATKAVVKKHVVDKKNDMFHWEAKQQMMFALKHYVSGTQLKMADMVKKVEQTDTGKARQKARDEEGEALTPAGFILMNVPPPPGQDFGMSSLLAALKKRNNPMKKAEGPAKPAGGSSKTSKGAPKKSDSMVMNRHGSKWMNYTDLKAKLETENATNNTQSETGQGAQKKPKLDPEAGDEDVKMSNAQDETNT